MSQNSREKRPLEATLLSEDEILEPEAKRPNLDLLSSNEANETDISEISTVLPTVALIECITDIGGVPGLRYYREFVNTDEERLLLEAVDAGTWDNSLKRRVQHFGLRYDYSAKSVVRDAAIEPLPDFLNGIVTKMGKLGQFPSNPDQCIVNEYTPGQGINPHIDRVDSFGPCVASLSLQSSVIMVFSNGEKKVEVLLEPRSMVLLTGDSRFKWKHSISPRKTDVWEGRTLNRDRRVSLTFRTVKTSYSPSPSSFTPSSTSSLPKITK